ncbi:hypothetical protein OHB11_27165 [Streptomyces zaomyceticus]
MSSAPDLVLVNARVRDPELIGATAVAVHGSSASVSTTTPSAAGPSTAT